MIVQFNVLLLNQRHGSGDTTLSRLITCPKKAFFAPHISQVFSLKVLQRAAWLLENEAIHIFVLLLLVCVVPSRLTSQIFISPREGELFPVSVTTKLSDASQIESQCFHGRKEIYQRDQTRHIH